MLKSRILRLKRWILISVNVFRIFTDAWALTFSSPLTLTFEVPSEASSSRSDATSTATSKVVERRVVDVISTAADHFSTTSSSETSREVISVVLWHKVRWRNAEKTWRRFRHLIHAFIHVRRFVSNLVVDPSFSLLIHFIVWHDSGRWTVHVDLMWQREHVWHWKVAMVCKERLKSSWNLWHLTWTYLLMNQRFCYRSLCRHQTSPCRQIRCRRDHSFLSTNRCSCSCSGCISEESKVLAATVVSGFYCSSESFPSKTWTCRLFPTLPEKQSWSKNSSMNLKNSPETC